MKQLFTYLRNPEFQKWGLTAALVLALGATISLNPETKYIARNDGLPKHFRTDGVIEMASSKTTTIDLGIYYPEYKNHKVEFTYNEAEPGKTNLTGVQFYRVYLDDSIEKDAKAKSQAEASCLDCFSQKRMNDFKEAGSALDMDIAKRLVAQQAENMLKEGKLKVSTTGAAGTSNTAPTAGGGTTEVMKDELAKYYCRQGDNMTDRAVLSCARKNLKTLISDCQRKQNSIKNNRDRDPNKCRELVEMYYENEIKESLKSELKQARFTNDCSYGDQAFVVLRSTYVCADRDSNTEATELRDQLLDLDSKYFSRSKRNEVMAMTKDGVGEQARSLSDFLYKDMEVSPFEAKVGMKEFFKWNAGFYGHMSKMDPYQAMLSCHGGLNFANSCQANADMYLKYSRDVYGMAGDSLRGETFSDDDILTIRGAGKSRRRVRRNGDETGDRSHVAERLRHQGVGNSVPVRTGVGYPAFGNTVNGISTLAQPNNMRAYRDPSINNALPASTITGAGVRSSTGARRSSR